MRKTWTPFTLDRYWKAVLGFVAPGAVIIGGAVLEGSPGDSAITFAEWVTAIVAMIVTGASVASAKNED
jgi:hypothetical protein